MQNYEIPLHDIKPIIEVQEYSLYYLIALIVVAIGLLLGVAYLVYKWLEKRNAFNIRKEHFKLINELDFKDTKKAAYAITVYGYTFKDDSPRHSEMYKNLVNRLDEYKYKKDVEAFDSEVMGYVELYKEMLDV
jgi:hypothetical protein